MPLETRCIFLVVNKLIRTVKCLRSALRSETSRTLFRKLQDHLGSYQIPSTIDLDSKFHASPKTVLRFCMFMNEFPVKYCDSTKDWYKQRGKNKRLRERGSVAEPREQCSPGLCRRRNKALLKTYFTLIMFYKLLHLTHCFCNLWDGVAAMFLGLRPRTHFIIPFVALIEAAVS